MFWLSALLLAQSIECPLEAELRPAPLAVYRPLKLQKQRPAKGMEQWGGVIQGQALTLSRRIADGAVGMVVAGTVVPLRPMGMLGVEGETRIPVSQKGFPFAPLSVRVFRSALGFGASAVTIQVADAAYVGARCGPTLVLVSVTGVGPQGADVNGDGKVDPNSPAEYARTQRDSAAFQIEGRALAVDQVDWSKRVLRMRVAEALPEFAVGEQLADFRYLDRLQASKTLSSHGESYTLIDYWASWCAPCVAAFLQIKTIAESHQLQVLGINGDEDPALASRVLAQFEVLWPDVQATTPSALFDYRLRVPLYPTYLLLDAKRKIVFRTSSTLELLDEVRRVVPRRKGN